MEDDIRTRRGCSLQNCTSRLRALRLRTRRRNVNAHTKKFLLRFRAHHHLALLFFPRWFWCCVIASRLRALFLFVVVVHRPNRGEQKKEHFETLSTFFFEFKKRPGCPSFLPSTLFRTSVSTTRETRAQRERESERGREKGKGRETREKERARVQQLSFFLFGKVFGKS